MDGARTLLSRHGRALNGWSTRRCAMGNVFHVISLHKSEGCVNHPFQQLCVGPAEDLLEPVANYRPQMVLEALHVLGLNRLSPGELGDILQFCENSPARLACALFLVEARNGLIRWVLLWSQTRSGRSSLGWVSAVALRYPKTMVEM